MADRRGDGIDIDRRRLLKYLGAGSVAGLAGCSSNSGTVPKTARQNNNSTGTTGTPPNTGNGNGNDDQLPVGGTFKQGTVNVAGPPHPLLASDDATMARIEKMFDGPGGALAPETFYPKWFKSFNLSDSNDVVTYELREGLTWGAGYGELTVEDYLYTLNNIVLLEGNDWFGFTDTNFYRLGGEFISYEKLGKRRFKAELPVQRPFWLHEDPLLNLVPLPKSLLEQYVPGRDRDGLVNDEEVLTGALSKGESTLGPYQLESYEVAKNWQYERNPDYYLQDAADEPVFADAYYDFRNSPYFQNFEFRVVTAGGGSAVGDLSFPAVTGARIPARSVSQFADRAGVTLWQSRFGTEAPVLHLNHRINGWSPVRQSQDVRRAMAEIYDQQTVVNDVFAGFGVVTNTLHPRWGPFYPPQSELYVPEGSIERARDLLEVGTLGSYSYDRRGRFTGPTGEQITLTAVHTKGDQEGQAAAQYMKRRLEGTDDQQGAGIALEIEVVSPATLLNDYIENSAENVPEVDTPDWTSSRFNGGPWNQSASRKEWDMLFGRPIDTSPYAPWSAIRSSLAEQGTFNFTGYHQDTLDIEQFLFEAASSENRATTQERLTKLFGFLSRDLPAVWTHTNFVNLGFYFNVQHLPGVQTDSGYRATSYFKTPDPARLQAFQS